MSCPGNLWRKSWLTGLPEKWAPILIFGTNISLKRNNCAHLAVSLERKAIVG